MFLHGIASLLSAWLSNTTGAWTLIFYYSSVSKRIKLVAISGVVEIVENLTRVDIVVNITCVGCTNRY